MLTWVSLPEPQGKSNAVPSSSLGFQSELPSKSEDHKDLWYRQDKQSWFSQLWNPPTQARYQLPDSVYSCAGSWRTTQWSKQTPWGNKDSLWWWWFNCTPSGGLFKARIKLFRNKNICNFQGFCLRTCCRRLQPGKWPRVEHCWNLWASRAVRIDSLKREY